MHYCVLLFTNELPSEEKIAEIMHPYYEGNAEYDEETENRLNPYPVFVVKKTQSFSSSNTLIN